MIAIGSARPIFDDSAAQIASVLTIRDDSARHEAEIALRESEERLRLVIDAASDYAIFTTDPERIVTSWSRGAELAFGYTASEIIGQCADILWTPEDQAKGQPKHEAEVASAEGCANNERWHQRQDGSRVFMNGSVHPLPANEDGSERGFIKIARDETERRAADEDLKRLNERLSLESQRLSDMFEQAPSLMAMLRGPDHVFELANPG